MTEILKELFNESGQLIDGVRIMGTDGSCNSAEGIACIKEQIQQQEQEAQNSSKNGELVEADNKQEPFNDQSKLQDKLGDEFDETHHEFRNLFRQKTYHELIEYIYKIDYRRITIVREHIINSWLYAANDHIKDCMLLLLSLTQNAIHGNDKNKLLEECNNVVPWIEEITESDEETENENN